MRALALLACLVIGATASAQVLVVAPHPDDDVLTAAGVIARTVARGMTVRVVYLTNGDYNGVAVGLQREAEAVTALGLLGVPESQLIFFGYPDGGLEIMRVSYPTAGSAYTSVAGQSASYGNRGLGGKDYHSYRFGSPGAYNWANVIGDLADVIATYRPTQILTTSEFDAHWDHATTDKAVVQATTQVIGTYPGYNPTIHRTFVWAPSGAGSWPSPPDPTAYFAEIPTLAGTGLTWANRESLDVPLSMQVVSLVDNLKGKAIDAHQSQHGLNDYYLASFIHEDEFFWPGQLVAGTHAPVPNAGPGQTVSSGAFVTLSGTASWDPGGQPLTYTWRQSAGPAVSLSNTASISPTFTAPIVTAATTLAFELVVSKGTLTSLADAVTIVVTTGGSSNTAPVANAGPDQAIGAGLTMQLNGAGSADPNGDPITFAWTQTGGPAVALSNVTSANPTFVAPTGAQTQVLTFSLIVSDGSLTSVADTMTVTVLTDGTQPNIASLAAVTASSETAQWDQLAIRAVDGVVDGYPGDYTKEWATAGQGIGAWIQLTWTSAYSIDRVRLHDRLNLNDQILSGTLSFSDGSTVAVPALANNGSSVDVWFTPRAVTGVRLTVNSVKAGSTNIGLAELLVFPAAPANTAPVANAGPDQSVTAGASVQLNGSGSTDVNGDPLTYAWTQTAGPAVALIGATTVTPSFTAPGATQAVTLTFSLTVSDGSLSSAADGVTITVNPAPTPVATLSPASLTFASQTIGTTSAGQTVTLSNTGAGPLTINSFGLAGANSADFGYSSTCGATLAAGASCAFTVTFTPTATGARTASLTIADNATGSPHSVSLTGTGAGLPAVSLSPASLTFASQTIGTTSAGQTVTLSNTGSAPLTISSVSLTGTHSTDFARTTTCGASLAAGATCTITVTFTPTATGTRTASLTLADNATGSPHSVSLTGTGAGIPAVSLSPASLTFASQTIGTTSAGQTVTLSNTGSASLTISSVSLTGTHSTDFARTTTCGASLAAGATCTTTVTFTPTATGTRTASLTIADNATGSPHNVSLTGTGAGLPVVSLSPASLTFASQTIGTTSAGQTVTLSNTGSAPLTISSVSLTGTHSTDFARTTTCGANLAAGATCTITVTFTPTATGARTASLSIADNATGSPHSVSLTGTGAGLPAVSLSPASLTFASQTIGTTSAGQTVTLSNTGSAPLTISSVSLTGTHSTDFARTTTCGASLAAGATCTITVTFTPTATGTRTASLTLADNATGSPHSVSLTGTGAAAGSSNIAALATVTASSQNTSTGQLAVKAVDGVVDGYPGDYTREWAAAGQKAGAWIQLTFAASYAVDRVRLHDRPNTNDQVLTGTLSFSDGSTVAVGALTNSGAAVDVTFSARTVTWVRFTVNSVSAGTANVGLAEILVFGGSSTNSPPLANAGSNQTVAAGSTVQLDGSASTDANGDPLTYAWTQTSGPAVTLNGSTSATPTFVAPSSSQTELLTFSLVVSDGLLTSDPGSVTVTVQAALAPAVSLSPASLTFASQTIGTTSAGQTVTLSNTGSASLTISSVSLTGTNSTDFGYSSTCGATLAAGASCAFTVTFTPTATGTRTASLSITDNATGSPHNVSLTGTGAAAGSSNIAALATVTASSQNTSTGQLAVKAVDGVVDGYPGDYTREWAAAGQKAGAWIQLTFAASYAVDRVRLHDRPNTNDQVLTGTLSFSDGSTVAVGALTNSGAAVDVTFSARTVTWVRFTVNSVSAGTANVGLAEILVFGSAAAEAFVASAAPIPFSGPIDENVTPQAEVARLGHTDLDALILADREPARRRQSRRTAVPGPLERPAALPRAPSLEVT